MPFVHMAIKHINFNLFTLNNEICTKRRIKMIQLITICIRGVATVNEVQEYSNKRRLISTNNKKILKIIYNDNAIYELNTISFKL